MKLKYHQKTFALLGREPKKSAVAVKQIAVIERRLKIRLPAAVKEWYSLAGAVKLLYEHSNQDEPTPLEELGSPYEVSHGVLKIQTENQGVAEWYVRLDGSEDPPVLVESEFHHEPDETWDDADDGDYLSRAIFKVQSPSFSEYVYQCVLQFEGNRGVREIAQGLQRLGAHVAFDARGSIIDVMLSEDTDKELSIDLLQGHLLTRLDVCGGDVPFDFWGKLRGLKRLADISISDRDFNDNDLSLVAKTPGLRHMKLFVTRLLTNRGLGRFLDSVQLESLYLQELDITDAGLKGLAGQLRLEQLWLYDMPLNGRGLKYLAALPRLKWLQMRETPLTDGTLRHLAELRAIELIGMEYIPITDRGLKHFSRLSTLRKLELRGAAIVGGGLKHLTPLPRLRELNLQETPLTDAAVPQLVKIRSLRRLNLRHCQITADGFAELRRLRPRLEIEAK